MIRTFFKQTGIAEGGKSCKEKKLCKIVTIQFRKEMDSKECKGMEKCKLKGLIIQRCKSKQTKYS